LCVQFKAPGLNPPKPIDAQPRLTHLSADVWRADYELSEPVLDILFDRVGAYRRK
jgi:hypothetical protein